MRVLNLYKWCYVYQQVQYSKYTSYLNTSMYMVCGLYTGIQINDSSFELLKLIKWFVANTLHSNIVPLDKTIPLHV